MSREICVVTGIFPPESGGPAKFALTFSQWLVKNKHLVSVLTLTDGPTTNYELNGFMVRRITRNMKLPLRYLKTIFEIRKNSHAGKIILANGCFLETGLAFLGSKSKYITKVPGDIVWERAINNGMTKVGILEFQKLRLPFKYRVFRYLFSLALKRSSYVIVPSNELKELCIGWGVKPEQIKVVYNSVSLDTFFPNKEIEKVFDLVTVARLVPWKGVGEIVQCAATYSLKLAVVGDGPQLIELQNLAQKLRADVTFFGNKTQSEMPDILNAARYFILNSDFEATSYALLEARACGLVAIANAGTGSEEVIRDHIDGLLIQRITGPDLSECIKEVSHSTFDYNSYSQAAVSRTSNEFNVDINFGKILKIALSC